VSASIDEIPLGWSTPPLWAQQALENPLELLIDHAHCELGAASTAQGLIARHPDIDPLVDRFAALASEELRHFRRVHRLLRERGGVLRAPGTNAYAGGLVRAIDRTAPDALCDRLIVSGLIERRSLERFELLAEAAEDAEMARMFEELGPSEMGHALMFVDLARVLFPAVDVEARLARWTEFEADLISGLPFAARVHSGPPLEVARKV
jgi:tRNA-(ms[2]io[6]A)-hydroxylase